MPMITWFFRSRWSSVLGYDKFPAVDFMDVIENVGDVFKFKRILSIRYGNSIKIKNLDLYLKVRWKNYVPKI